MKSVVYFENTVKIGKYLAGVIVNTNQDIFKVKTNILSMYLFFSTFFKSIPAKWRYLLIILVLDKWLVALFNRWFFKIVLNNCSSIKYAKAINKIKVM